MSGPTYQTLVTRQRERLLEALRSALGGVDRVALVGFPDHNNVGDSAIWVGTCDALRALGVTVGYAATWWSYSAEHLRRAVGGAPVLIHGGGNLGDRYLHEQELRERVLRDLRDRPVLQMPQTVGFSDEARARGFARIAARRPAFCVFVRDHVSASMLARLDLPATVVPDAAFAMNVDRLRPWPSSVPATRVLWLARTDIECRSPADDFRSAAGVRMLDWPEVMGPLERWPAVAKEAVERTTRLRQGGFVGAGVGTRAARRVIRLIGREERYPAFGRTTGHLGDLDEFAAGLQHAAAHRVATGLGTLASAGTVVTDRLHAHVLSVLVGVPSVVYDNTDRKLSRYWDTWTPPAGVATWAAGAGAAWEAVAAN